MKAFIPLILAAYISWWFLSWKMNVKYLTLFFSIFLHVTNIGCESFTLDLQNILQTVSIDLVECDRKKIKSIQIEMMLDVFVFITLSIIIFIYDINLTECKCGAQSMFLRIRTRYLKNEEKEYCMS